MVVRSGVGEGAGGRDDRVSEGAGEGEGGENDEDKGMRFMNASRRSECKSV